MSIANHADLVGRVAVVNHDHRSITLTVTVRNEGPLQITTPMVRFTVPAGVNTMLELGGAWRCTDVAPFVCTAESLAPTWAELRVRLVRTQPTAGGLVTIDVLDASSSTTDPIPENNRLQVTLPLD